MRRAVIEDLAAARDVIIKTCRTTYYPIHGEAKVEDIISRWHSPNNIEHQINSGDALFGVAILNDECVGHVYAKQSDYEFKIMRLYVLPSAQGKGVGRKLMAFAIQNHPTAKVVNLEVDEANEAAIKFYQHLGMSIAGSAAHCGDDSDIPILIMSAPCEKLRIN